MSGILRRVRMVAGAFRRIFLYVVLTIADNDF